MNFEIIKTDQRNSWDELVQKSPYGSFLQSWMWGEFQKSLGRKVWRVIVRDKELLGAALIIRHDLMLGKNYLYAPRGPVIKGDLSNEDKDRFFSVIKQGIAEIAKNEKSVFAVIEPEWKESEAGGLLEEYGFKKFIKDIQPRRTIILDLSKTEQEIRDSFKKKTRYSLRIADKSSLFMCRPDTDAFWGLLKETSKRGKFRLHPKDYYKKMIEKLADGEYMMVLGACEGKKLIGANIVSFFGNKASYLHSASAHDKRSLMAPYWLQWQTILEAKKRGMTKYDLWGISEKWPGVSHFKRGFNGQEVRFIGSYVLVFNSLWYLIYKLRQYIMHS